MRKMSHIKEKILQVLEKKGISKYKFYKESGITRGVLDKDSGISESNITKFIAYLPDISIEWLLTGEGEMLKKEGKNEETGVENRKIEELKAEIARLRQKNEELHKKLIKCFENQLYGNDNQVKKAK